MTATDVLICTVCGDPIAPDVNRFTDPPAHIHCGGLERLKLGEPEPPSEEEQQIRRWVADLQSWGSVWRLGPGGDAREIAIQHSERDIHTLWDLWRPDGTAYMPQLEVWRRECPGDPWWAEGDHRHLPCRHGHLHLREHLRLAAAAVDPFGRKRSGYVDHRPGYEPRAARPTGRRPGSGRPDPSGQLDLFGEVSA